MALDYPNDGFVPREVSVLPPAPAVRASASSPFDRVQLTAPLAVDQGESSWYCFEGAGRGEHGPRRIAGLVWLHRTGPRASRLGAGPGLIERDALPARWRDLVPSWLPIVSPVSVAFDDRPLFMVVLYDLDDPAARPLQIELPIEHADFDGETFSAATSDRALELHHFAPERVRDRLPAGLRAFVGDECHAVAVQARCPQFELQLHVRARKPAVCFGDDGSPRVRHGRIEVGYAQRSRLDLVGSIALRRGSRIEPVVDFVAQGAHDRHWRDATVIGLRWLWLHLRLPGERELVAYVIRDARGGRDAGADDGRELGRSAWLIDAQARVQPLARFELCATAHADTERGRIPTRFALDVPDLRLQLDFEHAVALPYLPMRAFGEVAQLGIYEAPIRVLSASEPGASGWLEIVPALQ